jgi:hypothetical protein
MTELLTYTNGRGESVEFSPASRYHANMKDVSGLSDVSTENYTISSMGQDGDTFIGNRINSREIEIVGHIKSRDKAETQSLRRWLNHVLNPQAGGLLAYDLNGYRRVISCRVDSAPLFNRRSPIYEQFTVNFLCPHPFWREEHETATDVAAWIGGMEFPIRGPDDQPDGLELFEDESWEIGYRMPSMIANVANLGDVRAGMRVEFRALGDLANPSLLNVETGEFIQINMAMQPDDVLTVSTGYGEKGAALRRNGIESDAFRYVDVDSTYLQLEPGDNFLRYNAETGFDNLEITIYHSNYFLGV